MIIPTLRSPIVFAHGLGGFDRLALGRWVFARYWAGIPEKLQAAGNRVLVARVSPLGSVAKRAGQLKAILDAHAPREPVHVFAHSMGGLDARYMISRLGMAGRVLSLTTLGTPHRGTAFADWGLRRLLPVCRFFFDVLGISSRAFEDLSVAGCRAFNERCPDAPGVRYFSVAGRIEAGWSTPEWRLSGRVIEREQGPNDGLVAITSARYGEDCSVWDGDHLALVNFRNPLARLRGWADRTPAYGGLVRRLADEGF